jgi:Ca2+/H+ antiporter, TMEM165/GDT1 family
VNLPGIDLGAAAQAFVAVFPAELPDKSMFASMALVTRFGRPRLVWLGAACAFAFHSLLASAFGGLVSTLPTRPVAFAAGLLFAVGAAFMVREARRSGGAQSPEFEPAVGATDRSVVVSSFMLLGVAEVGDLTQFAIAGLAARTGEPVSVGIGGWLALCSVAGLAVTVGRLLTSRFDMARLQLLGAAVFVALSVWSFVEAFA